MQPYCANVEHGDACWVECRKRETQTEASEKINR